MRASYFIFFFFFLFSNKNLKAIDKLYFIDSSGIVIDSCSYLNSAFNSNIELQQSDGQRPNPILQFIKKKQRKNKKIIAAILAFPFPFGIVGLHRIYLGTAPHVPIVYIGTFGGVLGILPFIDFCVLILDKDFDRYMNNKKIFMWVN